MNSNEKIDSKRKLEGHEGETHVISQGLWCEKANIYALTFGNPFQICICKGSKVALCKENEPYLMQPKNTESKFTLSPEGKVYLEKFQKQNFKFPYNFVGYKYASIEFDATGSVMETLKNERIFWAWDPIGGPVEYYHKNNSVHDYLLVLRVYATKEAIPIADYDYLVNRFSYVFPIKEGKRKTVEIGKPVLSDVEFESMYNRMVQIIRESGALLQENKV